MTVNNESDDEFSMNAGIEVLDADESSSRILLLYYQ